MNFIEAKSLVFINILAENYLENVLDTIGHLKDKLQVIEKIKVKRSKLIVGLLLSIFIVKFKL